MPELRVRALSRSFKNGDTVVHAVRNLDLTIPEGEFTVIVGRSGCGKTTLLRLISGLETPDPPQAVPGALPAHANGTSNPNCLSRFIANYRSARLSPLQAVFARSVTDASLPEPRRLIQRILFPHTPSPVPHHSPLNRINRCFPSGQPRFGFMFQDARLLPWLSVEENLRLAFPPLPRRDKAQTAEARREMDDTIDRLLKLVGLDGWKKASPRSLSGGMAQRVALVRALCRNPRILLLDEPFGALDAFTRTQLREDMDRLWHTMKRTVLLVTHDIEEAVHLADRVLLMKDGRIAGEVLVPLERPRQRRGAEFQDLCREIESRMQ